MVDTARRTAEPGWYLNPDRLVTWTVPAAEHLPGPSERCRIMSRQSPPKLKKTSRKTKPRAVKRESAVPRGSSRAGGESAEVQRANARSNAELLETIRRQEELLEHGHDCIMIQDVNSGIVFWNRGCEETYGWRKHEAQGQTSQRLLFTQFSATEEEARRSLMEKGLWEGELVHTTKDGKQITVESRQILQRDASGMPARIFES